MSSHDYQHLGFSSSWHFNVLLLTYLLLKFSGLISGGFFLESSGPSPIRQISKGHEVKCPNLFPFRTSPPKISISLLIHPWKSNNFSGFWYSAPRGFAEHSTSGSGKPGRFSTPEVRHVLPNFCWCLAYPKILINRNCWMSCFCQNPPHDSEQCWRHWLRLEPWGDKILHFGLPKPLSFLRRCGKFAIFAGQVFLKFKHLQWRKQGEIHIQALEELEWIDNWRPRLHQNSAKDRRWNKLILHGKFMFDRFYMILWLYDIHMISHLIPSSNLPICLDMWQPVP